MDDYPDVASIARLIGHPARAVMLVSLLDGSARPASELAHRAGVSPATASAHLAKLVAAGILQVVPLGRHRYYRIRGPEVAGALEALAILAPPARPQSLSGHGRLAALREARTCYDHLAGRLGVAIADAILQKRWLERQGAELALTDLGARGFGSLGIDVAALARRRRPLVRACLDWSERRPHLAGSLGAALADLAFARGWVERVGSTRAVRVTPVGRAELKRLLGLDLPPDHKAQAGG